MLTWRYLSRLTKPWQQGSWQQVDVRNDSFPGCIPEFAVPSSVVYGAMFSRHLPTLHPVRGWRQRGSIIGGAAIGLYRESTESHLHRDNGAPSWALYRLLHPSSISIKRFRQQRHFLVSSQITGENFYLLSEEHSSVPSHTETYCSTETTSKVCKSNTNMMLQPG